MRYNIKSSKVCSLAFYGFLLVSYCFDPVVSQQQPGDQGAQSSKYNANQQPGQQQVHQQPPPAQQQVHQQPPPAQQKVHQQPPPAQQQVHQQPPPAQQQVHQQPPQAQQQVHQQPPPVQQQVHQQPPPAQQQVHQQPPQAQQQVHQQPPPVQQQVHQQPPQAQQQVHQQPPPAQQQVHQQPPPAQQQVHQQPPQAQQQVHQQPPEFQPVHQEPPVAQQIHQEPPMHQQPGHHEPPVHQPPDAQFFDNRRGHQHQPPMEPTENHDDDSGPANEFRTSTGHDFSKQNEMSLNFILPPKEKQCFYYPASMDFSVHFEVVRGTAVDFYVNDHTGKTLHIVNNKRRQSFEVDVNEDREGVFLSCIDNRKESWTQQHVEINFVIKADKRREMLKDMVATWTTEEKESVLSQIRSKREIISLLDTLDKNLDMTEELQSHFRRIESADRGIMEDNFTRVNTWSVFQLIVMVTVGFLQVFMIKSLFDERSAFHKLWKR